MIFASITQCRGCHAAIDRCEVVLTMDPMPLAGVFCPTEATALAAPLIPLTWMLCSECELVQVAENVSDATLFSHYNYSSSSIAGLVQHFVGYAEFLKARYSGSDRLSFLEIGCNDGVLLQRLPQHWNLLGVDPSDVALRATTSPVHYTLHNQPFTLGLVLDQRLEGKIDVISGSNCLAHISDLRSVFEAVALALRIGGDFWLEVHDLASLLRGCQWDTIYHEHKVEWSEQSLQRCLAPLGFSHVQTLKTPMHGGALRICFRKESHRGSSPVQPNVLRPLLKRLQEAYHHRYETKAARLLIKSKQQGYCIAAYGAAGRANVYLNQLQELRFDYIVDEAPLRVNKFIPRVATPIVPQTRLLEQPANDCLITAWNYREDIIRKNPAYSGTWLTAFEED